MAATKPNDAGGNAGSPYRLPPEPNRWPSIGLAVGVHALLLAFLWIGVSWQSNTPVAVEAEVWDVTTQTAAPPPPPPTPEPEPTPQPETPPPPPMPKMAPPPLPSVEQPTLPKPPPDIALAREKKRKEELKRQQEEDRQEQERELAQQEQQKRREDDKKAKALAEKQERLAEEAADKKAQAAADKKARALAEKKAQEDADKKAAELAKKDDADKKKKADKEKAAKEKAEEAKLAKLHDAAVKSMMSAAGNPGSTGQAEKSTAPRIDKGYLAQIVSIIKGNTSYAGDLDEPGNPTAVFHVDLLPTGEIISIRQIKSSGVATFDAAVKNGITKSSPLPKKKDGTVERSLEINFHMKDLQ